jgi:hypothetical protein
MAWDPFGNGKTAIRASIAIAHDFIEQNLNLNTESALPFRLTAIQTGVISLDNPYPQGDPFPYNYNPRNPVWPTTTTARLTSTCPPSFLPIPYAARPDDRPGARVSARGKIRVLGRTQILKSGDLLQRFPFSFGRPN